MSISKSVAGQPTTNSSRGNSWRSDIQGLRAIAVLTVVVFHAGLPLPGGFVGVDMFFVISGYVITALLVRELSRTRRINFSRFYARRIKRLTPALGLMVTVTVIASGLLLSPFGAQQNASLTGIGAMLLAANWVIFQTSGGYFDATAEANPLLHTWSLSVEEQFYLAFPAILAAGWLLYRPHGLRRAVPLFVVAMVAVGSVIMIRGAIFFGEGSWLVSFYSPLNRAWEFASGALLALVAAVWRIRLPQVVALILAALGSTLITASLFLIDDETPFPGKWTFLPVTATMLLIAAGWTSNPISTSLSKPLMVKVGDLSYSIYLWHWPFIVFAVALWPGTWWAAPAAAAVSYLPAFASYHLVEQPIRNWPTPMPARAKTVLFGVALIPIAVSTVVWASANYIVAPAHGTERIPAIRQGTNVDYSSFNECQSPVLRSILASWSQMMCVQSREDQPPSVVVLGDSHARALFPGVAEVLDDTNVMLVDNIRDPVDPQLPRYQDAIEALVNEGSVQTLVVTSYWASRGIPVASLDALFSQLAVLEIQVILVDDVPDFPYDPYQCQYRKAPIVPWTECSTANTTDDQPRTTDTAELQELADAHPNVTFVRAQNYLCEGASCYMAANGAVLYEDGDHLNLQGSTFVAQRLLAELKARGVSLGATS